MIFSRRTAIALGMALAALLILSGTVAASPGWMQRVGTIGNALSLADCSHVYLDAVDISKIRASQTPPYIVIAECFSARDRISVLTQPAPELRVGQTVDIEGDLTTLDSGDRGLTNVTVWGYTDSLGNLLYHGPLIKGIDAPTPWGYKVDLTVNSSTLRSATPSESEMNPPGEVTTDSSVEVVPCATIADAKAQDLGTLVELRCKPVSSVSSFVLGQDGSTDSISVNYTGTVGETSRVCVIKGTIDTDGTNKVLDIDSGQNYNVQESFQGSVSTAAQGSIAWAKTFADGHVFAAGDITGRVITRNWTDYLYIEDDTRARGIRVEKTAHGHVKGEVVSVEGTLATNSDGERYIAATTITQTGSGELDPLGMNNKWLGGGDFAYDPGPPISGQRGITGASGLNNIGLLVRVWGKVSEIDMANPAQWFRITDGSNVQAKVAYPPFAYALNDYVAISGISSCEVDTNGDLQRVLRPQPLTCTITQATGQSDPAITSPVNFTVTFSEPVYGFTADDVSISGTATRTGSPVVTPIGTDGAQYNVAVDGFTGYGTVIATVPAGGAQNDSSVWNYAATYTDNSVNYIGNVVYVKPGGTGDQSGKDWNNAKPTIQAGLNATDTYHQTQVWVAKGTYSERITLKSGVALYGGFAGTEAQLSERPTFQRAQPDANETVVDGGKAGSVVTIPSDATSATVIDGFTIRNGTGTSVSSSYYGGGIYCPAGATGSPVISHNKIAWNYVSSYGGGIYIGGGSPTITYNVITGNDGTYYGGGVCLANSTATIANNVISANGAASGGGIYCNTGTTTIVNNTIAVNDGDYGGGILCNNSVTITGNIIAYNCSGIWQTNTSQHPTINYNCLYNATADYTNVTLGTGNTLQDPNFARVSYGDLHIQPGSTCRNAGNNAAVQSLPTDIEGRTRILDTTVDMGAYESDGTTYSISDKVYRVIGTSGNDSNDGTDWDTPHAMATVQGAIDKAAQAGGEVWVKGIVSGAGGTYAGHFALKPFVYLYGGFGAVSGETKANRNWVLYTTTLDGTSNGRVLAFRGGYGVNSVDAFTIIRGYMSTDHGGGIYCSNSSPVISRNTLKNNSVGSYKYGGGIYCFDGSPLITGNWVGTYNNPNHAYDGGGIMSNYSKASIYGNYVEYNTATSGGGISSWGAATIVNNFIYKNTASQQGCGINRPGSGNALIANNTITYNTASGSLIEWAGGGGIYVYGGTSDTVTLANNIVAYNKYDGIYRDLYANLTLSMFKNCVYENRNSSNVLTPYVNITNYGTNFTTDPKLSTTFPWRIQTGSSCINTADTNYAPTDDIEGRQRGSSPDVGCYEY